MRTAILQLRGVRATPMADRPSTPKWNDSKGVPSPAPQQRAERSAPPRYKVSELLGAANEAILEHGGEMYRLRITSNRKLILTK
jgi:hemin uptake protein HemP